jgi:hypothetical protein
MAAAAVANPALFGFWLIGFLSTCTKHFQFAVDQGCDW